MHAGLFLCGNKTLLYSVFIIPEKPWVEWIIPYFTYIYKQDVPKVLKHHFLLLAHSELFLCTVLDTSIEKGVWENKQKTSHGITQHEEVKKKIIVFEAFMCPRRNKSVNYYNYCWMVSELAEVGIILASTYMVIKKT